MSDLSYIGKRMGSFKSSPRFDNFSRVVISVSDEIQYSAGTDNGQTLRLTCPWATPQMAENILAQIRTVQYQPYTADGAIVDPAIEIGDGITANNVYGGVYSKSMRFGPTLKATLAAPADEEIDHEYPYIPKQDRKISRSIRHLSSELTVQAGLISAEVRERKTETEQLFAQLKLQSDSITAEVNTRKTETEQLFAQLKLQSDSITAEVNTRKTETEQLFAQLKLQSDSITAEVNTRKTETEQLFAKLELQGESISAKVSKTGGDFSSFGWSLDDSSWTIKANSSDVLKATKNGLEVYGKVTATSGKIGGFDILSDYLSYNGQTWGGTNTVGGYFGVNGIQLGKNFKVDMSGNLTAESGTFLGAVNAGNIRYGEDYGTLHASGLTSHSIVGTQIGYGAVSTSYTSAGINTSLGYADYSNGVFQGWNTAQNMNCSTLNVTSKNFTFAEKTCYLGSIAVTTALGGTDTIQFIGWR